MKTRNIIIAALALMASAAFTTIDAAKKKVAVKADAKPVEIIQLNTSSDTLSYAAGYAQTNGLIPFLQQQFQVDTTYMADFIMGLSDAKDKSEDPHFKAYLAGTEIAKMIKERMLKGIGNELEGSEYSLSDDLFFKGFISAIQKDTTKFNIDNASALFNERMESIHNAKVEKQKVAGKTWLEDNAKKEGVITTPSGLQYKVITMGEGEKPQATDEVSVKYEGHLIDGTEFDSSYKRSDPITKFKANQVIKGWTEALTMMPVGSKWEVYVPQELGYGSQNMGKIPAYSTLIFTVELIDITKAEEPKAEEPGVISVSGDSADKAKKTTSKKKAAAKKK